MLSFELRIICKRTFKHGCQSITIWVLPLFTPALVVGLFKVLKSKSHCWSVSRVHFNVKDFCTAKMRCAVSGNRVKTPNSLALPGAAGRSCLPLHPLICVQSEFLIVDSFQCLPLSLTKKTRLNDASLANDTRKNHLSVHWCFFRFLSDCRPPHPQLTPTPPPPYLCCSFLSLSN